MGILELKHALEFKLELQLRISAFESLKPIRQRLRLTCFISHFGYTKLTVFVPALRTMRNARKLSNCCQAWIIKSQTKNKIKITKRDVTKFPRSILIPNQNWYHYSTLKTHSLTFLEFLYRI